MQSILMCRVGSDTTLRRAGGRLAKYEATNTDNSTMATQSSYTGLSASSPYIEIIDDQGSVRGKCYIYYY